MSFGHPMDPESDDNIYLLDDEFVRRKIACRVEGDEVYLWLVDAEVSPASFE